jgi:hypothetical protein
MKSLIKDDEFGRKTGRRVKRKRKTERRNGKKRNMGGKNLIRADHKLGLESKHAMQSVPWCGEVGGVISITYLVCSCQS